MLIIHTCSKKPFLLLCLVFLYIYCVNGETAVSDGLERQNPKSDETFSKESASEEETKVNENSNSVSGSDSDIEPSVDANIHSSNERVNDDFIKPVFAEAVSQNAGVSNDVTNTGQPIVVTLTDTPTLELQERANIPSILPSQLEKSEVKPSNKSDATVDENLNLNTTLENISQETKPILETVPSEDIVIEVPSAKDNASSTIEDKQEEIPSFSEWAQKRLEEAEKNNEQAINSSTKGQSVNGKSSSGAKLRWKNYASLDCGAKVVAANPEAGNPSAVLSPSRDEYKLNTCTSRIWFIVELCEAIQAKKIDLANFELFSSSPKDFVVSLSDRFPTREWSVVGQFTAKDERDVQSFDLNPHLFGKYIKVEIKSHYGSEHFCPISLFRVYGTSEFEVLQKEDPVHSDHLEDEDDDDDDLNIANGESPKNLFSSATDAVISIVKKAAEVLGKSNLTNETVDAATKKRTKTTPLISTCTTPSHLVVCNNCSDLLFGQVYELLSCKAEYIRNLISIPLIATSLYNSQICNRFGFTFKAKNNDSTYKSEYSSVESFFPPRFLGAMCNTMAVLENKVLLNISQQYPNVTKDTMADEDQIINIQTSEPHTIKTDDIKEPISKEDISPTEELRLDTSGIDSLKTSCSTDISYTSQIKPTKAFSSQIDIENTFSVPPHETKSSPELNSKEVPNIEIDKTAEPGQQQSNVTQIDQNSNSVESSNEKDHVTTDSPETIEDHLEHFISEFGDQGHKDHDTTPPSVHTPQVQKESVFLRLSNRIKALERNMSLSGQYLEELSKRYKKQVEEMQKLLDKTISTLNEEGKKKDERNQQLEEKLKELTAAVESLIAEKNSWYYRVQCIFILSLAMFGIFTFCGRSSRYKRPPSDRAENPEIQRRKSIDVVTHSTPKKKRRPSDQALKIVRSAMLASDHEDTERRSLKERRKKKKKNGLKRSSSINTLNEETVSTPEFRPSAIPPVITKIWSRQESAPAEMANWMEGMHNRIEEIPFVLDESEHSTLEAIPTSIDNVDAPLHVKTASEVRQSRLTTHNGPIQLNGNQPEVTRKSVSLDETNSRKSPAPSLNGASSIASSSDQDQKTPKKDKKGFKKLFKRVF